jgi:hypothetical protein
MKFLNNIFKEVIEKYADWATLRSFLESEEGGYFRVVDEDADQCLIRYDKSATNMNLPHSKWFRSVVWSKSLNLPICVAPPKASTDPVEDNREIICQEFLDGFMINCFRFVNDDKLYITSRSKLNAAGHFYSNKSFRTLFMEAFLSETYPRLGSASNEEAIQTKTRGWKSPDGTMNEVAVFYSFLVQHTEHRVVKPIEKNAVFLVHSGTVFNDGSITMNTKDLSVDPFVHQIPLAYQLDNQSWDYKGLMFRDNLGNRWKRVSEKYTSVKSLRGNSATVLERFAQMYTQNLSHIYLQYYPEDAFYFSYYTYFINSIYQKVFQHYLEVFVFKTAAISNIKRIFVPYLYEIHRLYLSRDDVNKKEGRITLAHVSAYIQSRCPKRLLSLIKENQDEYFANLETMLASFAGVDLTAEPMVIE